MVIYFTCRQLDGDLTLRLDVSGRSVVETEERRVYARVEPHHQVTRVSAQQNVRHRQVHVEHGDHCCVVDTPRSNCAIFGTCKTDIEIASNSSQLAPAVSGSIHAVRSVEIALWSCIVVKRLERKGAGQENFT